MRKTKEKKQERRAAAHLEPPRPPANLSGDLTRDLESVFNDGVLVDLDIGFWTARARNKPDDLNVEQEDIPEYVIGLGTKRLIPKELSDSWQQIAASARYWLRKHSFMFPIAETSFVPVKALTVAEEKLREFQTQFFQARDHLHKNFDSIREKYLSEFDSAERAKIEPLVPTRDEVHRRFYFTWAVYNVTLPKHKLSAFDRGKHAAQQEAVLRYQRELEQRVQRFLGEAVATLRAKTVDLCRNIADQIKSGKVVQNRSLNALRDFIDRFKMMNFVGDREVEERLDRLKHDILNGRDADAFAEDAVLKRALSAAVDGLIGAAEQISDVSAVTGGYRRRIVV